MSQRIDRRHFLMGAGGAVLALPMLESLAPRVAFGQSMAPPKRLIIFATENGRGVGNGRPTDWWSPGTTSGPLPAAGTAPSQMLAPLSAIRDEIVTIDGIDNIVRHASGNGDGHDTPVRSGFTCKLPTRASGGQGGGPSIDYVAGLRLRAGATMNPSVIFPASATPEGDFFNDERFWTDARVAPHTVSGNPRQAIEDLFGTAPSSAPPPPRPTLHDRLVGRRTSLLDGVARGLSALRTRVNARDREQLDHHADYIRTLEMRLSGTGTGTMMAMGCRRPDETAAPRVIPSTYDEFVMTGRNPMWERGRSDPLTIPYTIENVVQALACDVTRVAVLSFAWDFSFASEFPGGATPFAMDDSFHGTIHGVPRTTDNAGQLTAANNVKTGFLYFARTFTQLVQRLAAVRDTDGSRLLDNTLVLWSSELGYGAEHLTCNLPVVLAGLGSAFAKGRHIVENRRTTGDLYAHMLRLLGGTDTTFGETGTLGALAMRAGVTNLFPDYGASGYINASTPLHRGPLSL